MPQVYVVGSINADLVVVSERFPKTGETIHGQTFTRYPGGKGANQAVAAARLGADVALIGALGIDSFGQELREFLETEKVDTQYILECETSPTGVALISVAEKNNKIIVVAGANEFVMPESVESLPLQKNDVCVAQLETPLATARALFQRARVAEAVCVLNPSPAIESARGLFTLVDILILNEVELGFFCGVEIDEHIETSELVKHVATLGMSVNQYVIVTLGAKGAVVVKGKEFYVETAGHNVSVVDTTGAGDCFCGAFAAFLSRGLPIENAVVQANLAAALSVQKAGAGTSMPTISDLEFAIQIAAAP